LYFAQCEHGHVACTLQSSAKVRFGNTAQSAQAGQSLGGDSRQNPTLPGVGSRHVPLSCRGQPPPTPEVPGGDEVVSTKRGKVARRRPASSEGGGGGEGEGDGGGSGGKETGGRGGGREGGLGPGEEGGEGAWLYSLWRQLSAPRAAEDSAGKAAGEGGGGGDEVVSLDTFQIHLNPKHF
jgi:hypothetical protein